MKLVLGMVIVLVCLVLAVLALPFLVDLNRYQDQYRPLLEEALNRKVSIKNIRLMIVPRLGARVQGVTIMDDPEFGTAPFASLSSFEIGVKLGPLLRRRIEVEEVVLHDPAITVIKNAKGVLNVSTLGRRAAAGPSPDGPPPILGLLAVDEVALTGGKVAYTDRSNGQAKEFVLADLELIMKSLRVGQIAGLHLSTMIHPYNLPVTVDGSFGPLQDTLALKDFDFAVRTGGAVSNIKGSAFGGSLKLGITSQIINSAELPLPLNLPKPVKVHNLDFFVETPYPLKEGVPIQDMITQAKLEFDLELGNSAVIVAGGGPAGNFHLAATADSIFTADIPIALPLTKSVQIKDLKLEAEARYPAPDGRAIEDAVTVNILAFEVVMGTSVLTVNGSGPAADFKMTVTSGSLNSTDLPIAAPLRRPVEIKDLRLAVEVHRPRVQVSSLTFSLFQGQVQGSAETTVGVKPMPFEGKVTLQGVQLAPVMEAVSNSPITVSGTAVAQLAVTGIGFSSAELTEGLTGTGRVSAKDGMLQGIDLLNETTGLGRSLGLPLDSSNATAFDTLDTTFHIARGLVNVDRFQLQSRLLEASAAGTIGFDQSLKLRTKITPSGKRVTIPMIIGGTIQAPAYSLDTTAIGAGFRRFQEEAVSDLLKGKKTPDDLLKRGKENLEQLLGP